MEVLNQEEINNLLAAISTGEWEGEEEPIPPSFEFLVDLSRKLTYLSSQLSECIVSPERETKCIQRVRDEIEIISLSLMEYDNIFTVLMKYENDKEKKREEQEERLSEMKKRILK